MLGENGEKPTLQLQKSVASLRSGDEEEEEEEKPKKKVMRKVVKKVVKKKAPEPEPEEDLLGDAFAEPAKEAEPEEDLMDAFDEPEPEKPKKKVVK